MRFTWGRVAKDGGENGVFEVGGFGAEGEGGVVGDVEERVVWREGFCCR